MLLTPLENKNDEYRNVNFHIRDILREDLLPGDRAKLFIDGSCMAPVVQNRDQVTIEVKNRFYPGDIVAFYCPYNKKNFVHRLLGTINTNGGRKCLTMADNGVIPDVLVDIDDLIGKVISVSGRSAEISGFVRVKSGLRYLYWCGKLWFRKFSD